MTSNEDNIPEKPQEPQDKPFPKSVSELTPLPCLRCGRSPERDPDRNGLPNWNGWVDHPRGHICPRCVLPQDASAPDLADVYGELDDIYPSYGNDDRVQRVTQVLDYYGFTAEAARLHAADAELAAAVKQIRAVLEEDE